MPFLPLFTGIRHPAHVLTVPPTKACLLCATPASMDLHIQAMPVGTYRVQSPGFPKIVYYARQAFFSFWFDISVKWSCMDIVILKGVPAGVCSCHQDSGRQACRRWSFSDPSELEGAARQGALISTRHYLTDRTGFSPLFRHWAEEPR